MHFSNGSTRLQYSQTSLINLSIKDQLPPFLHIDANPQVRAQ
ncbi:hypothetical protein LT85_4871 [Collimonas arenae]|uniref:Uncharacterized protein n=1 Tax=Collimonas arenae TaxID=279058 RepID=A0A0A1FK30_9BURK|nr:hypothetical protein LT85_4871 [Collimonas arenae]